MKGYNSYISSVVYSYNGKHIVSGSGDGTIWVWDVETEVVSEPLKRHSGSVFSVACSPDGSSNKKGSRI